MVKRSVSNLFPFNKDGKIELRDKQVTSSGKTASSTNRRITRNNNIASVTVTPPGPPSTNTRSARKSTRPSSTNRGNRRNKRSGGDTVTPSPPPADTRRKKKSNTINNTRSEGTNNGVLDTVTLTPPPINRDANLEAFLVEDDEDDDLLPDVSQGKHKPKTRTYKRVHYQKAFKKQDAEKKIYQAAGMDLPEPDSINTKHTRVINSLDDCPALEEPYYNPAQSTDSCDRLSQALAALRPPGDARNWQNHELILMADLSISLVQNLHKDNHLDCDLDEILLKEIDYHYYTLCSRLVPDFPETGRVIPRLSSSKRIKSSQYSPKREKLVDDYIDEYGRDVDARNKRGLHQKVLQIMPNKEPGKFNRKYYYVDAFSIYNNSRKIFWKPDDPSSNNAGENPNDPPDFGGREMDLIARVMGNKAAQALVDDEGKKIFTSFSSLLKEHPNVQVFRHYPDYLTERLYGKRNKVVLIRRKPHWEIWPDRNYAKTIQEVYAANALETAITTKFSTRPRINEIKDKKGKVIGYDSSFVSNLYMHTVPLMIDKGDIKVLPVEKGMKLVESPRGDRICWTMMLWMWKLVKCERLPPWACGLRTIEGYDNRKLDGKVFSIRIMIEVGDELIPHTLMNCRHAPFLEEIIKTNMELNRIRKPGELERSIICMQPFMTLSHESHECECFNWNTQNIRKQHDNLSLTGNPGFLSTSPTSFLQREKREHMICPGPHGFGLRLACYNRQELQEYHQRRDIPIQFRCLNYNSNNHLSRKDVSPLASTTEDQGSLPNPINGRQSIDFSGARVSTVDAPVGNTSNDFPGARISTVDVPVGETNNELQYHSVPRALPNFAGNNLRNVCFCNSLLHVMASIPSWVSKCQLRHNEDNGSRWVGYSRMNQDYPGEWELHEQTEQPRRYLADSLVRVIIEMNQPNARLNHPINRQLPETLQLSFDNENLFPKERPRRKYEEGKGQDPKDPSTFEWGVPFPPSKRLLSEGFGQQQDVAEFYDSLTHVLSKVEQHSKNDRVEMETGCPYSLDEHVGIEMGCRMTISACAEDCPHAKGAEVDLEPQMMKLRKFELSRNADNTFNTNVMGCIEDSLDADTITDYTCPKCGCEGVATKDYYFKKLPEVLVLQAKRGSSHSGEEKSTSPIVPNQELSISEGSLSEGSQEVGYDFLAAISHRGTSAKGGHYVCDVKRGDSFYHTNDTDHHAPVKRIVNPTDHFSDESNRDGATALFTSRKKRKRTNQEPLGGLAPHRWKKNYLLLVKYKKENGHASPGCSEKYGGSNLGRWCVNQRQYFRKNNLTDDRVKKLDEIGFPWKVQQNSWNQFHLLLVKYKQENGHASPGRSEKYGGSNLGRWCDSQRCLKNSGNLTDSQTMRLNNLGFCWSPRDDQWNQNYLLLVKYKQENGHARPVTTEKYRGSNLGRWCTHQRCLKNSGNLTDSQIKRLNDLGFCWSPISDKWKNKYSILVKYKQENGHASPVPTDEYMGIKIGRWCAWQRYQHHRNKLDDDRMKKLDEIGFIWQFYDVGGGVVST